jgi:hypothetical protein
LCGYKYSGGSVCGLLYCSPRMHCSVKFRKEGDFKKRKCGKTKDYCVVKKTWYCAHAWNYQHDRDPNEHDHEFCDELEWCVMP